MENIAVKPIHGKINKQRPNPVYKKKKLASLQYKHGILKGGRANQNRPIVKRHVERKEKQRQ